MHRTNAHGAARRLYAERAGRLERIVMPAPDKDVSRGQFFGDFVGRPGRMRKRYCRHPALHRIGYTLHFHAWKTREPAGELSGQAFLVGGYFLERRAYAFVAARSLVGAGDTCEIVDRRRRSGHAFVALRAGLEIPG